MLRSAHVDADEVPIPAVFLCEDADADKGAYPALAMVLAVKVDKSDNSIYRCRWYKDPVGDGTKPAKCNFVSQDAANVFVGPPEYVLVTADTRFNNARNQSSGSWKGARGHLNVNTTGVQLWMTIAAEAMARADPDAPAVPSALLSEHESRSRDREEDSGEEMAE